MSQELIQSFQEYFKGKGEEISVEAAEGAIAMWEKGQGELVASLVNGSELWKPVVESYFKAIGLEVPESIKQSFTEVAGTVE